MKQMNSIERFRRFGKPTINAQDALKNKIFAGHPVVYTDNTNDLSQADSFTSDFVWLVDKNIKLSSNLPMYFKPKENTSVHLFPYVFVGKRKIKSWNSIKLVPTKNRTEDIIKQKIIGAYYDPWAGQNHFDIFFCGNTQTSAYKILKEKYTETVVVNSYAEAKNQSKTEMFWFIPDDIEIRNSFNLKKYIPDEWSMEYTHVFGNDKIFEFDGLALFPKEYEPTENELKYRFYVNKKEVKVPASRRINYDRFRIDTYEDYERALTQTTTEMFWAVLPHASPKEDFNFDITFKTANEYDRTHNHAFKHSVDDKETYDGIWLLSTHCKISKKEIEHRHILERKEWDIVASGPRLYDVFRVDNWDEYNNALEKTTTELFWATSRNLKLDSSFSFDLFFDDRSGEYTYDRNENHAFIHRVDDKDFYNGIFLMSKNKPVSKKEIEHRHLVQRKEWDIVASGPCEYDAFKIDTFEDYQKALKNSKTEMFWAISTRIEILDSFKLDLYFTHDNDYDRYQNHAFKHLLNGKENYNGLFLLSKHKIVTKKEIEHRFLVDRKEWDIVASKNIQYDKFLVDSWNEYDHALEKSTTELFWGISRNIDTSDFDFDLFFDDKDNEFNYERNQNHAFIHRVNDKDLYNGLFLFSKHNVVLPKEIEHRHLVKVKEWNIVASKPVKYNKFVIDSWEEYQSALNNTETEMFWGISKNIDTSNFDFDIYFSHENHYDRSTNHAFAHLVDDKKYYNGLFLFSKHTPVTQNEIEHRHIVDVKEWDIVASGPVRYDIFTVDTYEDYLKAIQKSNTEMFWAVSSNVDTSEFNFNVYFTHDNVYDRTTNHAFKHEVNEDTLFNGVFLLTKNIK